MLSGGAEVDERCDADDDDGNDSDRIHGSAPLLTLIYHINMEKKDRKPGQEISLPQHFRSKIIDYLKIDGVSGCL